MQNTLKKLEASILMIWRRFLSTKQRHLKRTGLLATPAKFL